MQPETIRPTGLDTLKTAIAQAVALHQQQQADAAAAAAVERQQAEQLAIAQFKLPFDAATVAALQPLNFRFEGNCRDPIAWFEYQDLTVEVSQQVTNHSHCDTWEYVAKRQGDEVLSEHLHVYPNSSWSGYSTPEQRGLAFLLFLHEAANTPTPVPAPPETGTYADFRYSRKQRERFVREALKGTLTGLTSTGVSAGACLQTALFAIETADLVVSLMDATPQQRQVLSVLTLERFIDWLGSKPAGDVVGSLDNEDHPACRYLKEKGLELAFSNLALYAEDGACVLGNDSTFPVPNALPLDIAGDWLPALLDWKTFDPNTDSTFPTFIALEVLSFLEPYQR